MTLEYCDTCYDRRVLRRAILALAVSLPLFAADAFYQGDWKIESASVAPWWMERQPPSAAESKTFVGKVITIGARSIAGPPPLACRNPHYAVKDYPADMLFQGMFGEMHDRDKSVDPAKVAESAGFHGAKWKTLETGCEGAIDFHFIDDSTAAFALNNYIYRLKKR